MCVCVCVQLPLQVCRSPGTWLGSLAQVDVLNWSNAHCLLPLFGPLTAGFNTAGQAKCKFEILFKCPDNLKTLKQIHLVFIGSHKTNENVKAYDREEMVLNVCENYVFVFKLCLKSTCISDGIFDTGLRQTPFV